MILPPIRKLFRPDPGNFIFDLDIVGAEAMYIAWEIGGNFKQDFLNGVAIHVQTMEVIYPEYWRIKPKHEPQYTKCKNMMYGTCYVGSPKGIGSGAAIPVPLVEKFQRYFFAKYPGVTAWHNRVDLSLSIHREVRNHFGYRVHYFERTDKLLPEAVNWLPQSSIGIVCQRAQILIRRHFPLIRQRLQVHDSIIFQVPYAHVSLVKELRDMLATDPYLAIPFPGDPLQLKWDFKASKRSWGDCKPFDWENLNGIT